MTGNPVFGVILLAAAIATIADFALQVGLVVRDRRQDTEQPRKTSAHIVIGVLILVVAAAVAYGLDQGHLVTVLPSIG